MLKLGNKFAKTETSIFTTMSELAINENAVNLSQGFPDFDGPDFIRKKAVWAMQNKFNQYANSPGLPMMRESVKEHFEKFYRTKFDPKNEVTIYSGATEALFVTFTTLVEQGDECIVFDPVYDSYAPVIRLSGGTVKTVSIELPSYKVDFEKLSSLFNEKTKLLVLNTPQNPTGKVFTVEELKKIAELCKKWNVIAICDEVYEHLIFDEAKHIPLATIEGMRDRTVTISSTGKTFSYTGWKIGFSLACEELTRRLRACHQFVTFATSTPFQVAMSDALKVGDEFYEEFQETYLEKRNLLFEILQNTGFKPIQPQGTYFILADYSNFSDEDDFTFAQRLTRQAKVASIPVSVFYTNKDSSQNLLRFCFCKGNETLEEAGEKLYKFSH
ncbi:MAG: aminotransferase class I/II-fold pyridoxal phosphate-dependent enzyme [Calditrichaeota bacterium]|nr:MAG: aminotransferase class I/II-fold pyridoxal phosphate-dependent enzyme [Calditrichota bacterium]